MQSVPLGFWPFIHLLLSGDVFIYNNDLVDGENINPHRQSTVHGLLRDGLQPSLTLSVRYQRLRYRI